MAAVELIQCKQLVWVVKLYTTQCIIYTTGYTTVHNIHPLSKPLTPSCVLSSVVFQHKSSKSQHFTSSPSRVVTTNEGPQKSKANLWLRNCTAPESS